MGLLDTDPPSHVLPEFGSELARLALGKRMGEDVPADQSSLASALSHMAPDQQCRERALEALQWFGLAPSSAKAGKLPPLPTKPVAPIDLVTVMLTHKLMYGPGG